MTALFRVVDADEPAEVGVVYLMSHATKQVELDPNDAAGRLAWVASMLIEITGLADAEIARLIEPTASLRVRGAAIARWRAGTGTPDAASLLALIALAGPEGLTLLGRLVLRPAEAGAVGGGCRG